MPARLGCLSSIDIKTIPPFMQERWNALGLRRAQGAAVLAVVLLVLVYYSSWMTRLLTVFLALIIIRCNLKPNEVLPLLSQISENFLMERALPLPAQNL